MTTRETAQPTPPPLVTLSRRGGLAAQILGRLDEIGDAPIVAALHDGAWTGTSGGALAARIRSVAAGLCADGVRPGDRIALLGGNGPAWLVLDLAVLAAGAITVPIYPTASPAQIGHVLADSGAVRLLVETPGHARAAASAGGPAAELFDDAVGRLVGAADGADEPDRRLAAIGADDIATIVYTSGTTGAPKGCVLTHRNVFAAAGNVVALLPQLFAGDEASTLLFLPLAHVFGRVTALGCLWAGVRTGLLATAAELTAELPRFRPSFLVLVPYALERIRKGARAAGLTPEAEQQAVEAGLAGRAWDGPAADGLRAALGGRLRHVICGGATLDATTAAFVTALDVQVLGAYGLTEASTAVSMSTPDAVRAGRVGRALPGSEVAVAEDGEVLVRGEQVSPGYWPLPDGSGAPGGWLHTGDLGTLDDDGFLAITGRRKEIIVTSGGKNVAPEPLEDRIRLHPGIAAAVVVGEGRPYVTALVFLEPPVAGVPDEDAVAAVQAAIDDANTLVSRAESVRRFRIVPGALTVADGLLTPSLKLRRAAIAERFAAEIASLYRTGAEH